MNFETVFGGQYFIYIEGKEVGPFDKMQVNEFLSNGFLNGDSLVRLKDKPDWIRIGECLDQGIFTLDPTLSKKSKDVAKNRPKWRYILFFTVGIIFLVALCIAMFLRELYCTILPFC